VFYDNHLLKEIRKRFPRRSVMRFGSILLFNLSGTRRGYQCWMHSMLQVVRQTYVPSAQFVSSTTFLQFAKHKCSFDCAPLVLLLSQTLTCCTFRYISWSRVAMHLHGLTLEAEHQLDDGCGTWSGCFRNMMTGTGSSMLVGLDDPPT
jgi:hypothetical protein